VSGSNSPRGGSPQPNIKSEPIKVEEANERKYTLPQTENPKFEQFLDLMLVEANFKPQQAKVEIVKFVKAMETNYTDTIRLLKEKAEILARKLRVLRSDRVNEQTEKTDLEKLFVSCIEEARREVMRRRFRTEVANRKT